MENISQINTDLIDISVLPMNLQEIIHAIGFRDTLVLLNAFPGQVIDIPVEPKPDCYLAQLIGEEKYLDLMNFFNGNSSLYIPKTDSIKLQLKRLAIFRMLDDGHSVSEISKSLDLTARRVQQIISENRQSNDNLDLFNDQ